MEEAQCFLIGKLASWMGLWNCVVDTRWDDWMAAPHIGLQFPLISPDVALISGGSVPVSQGL